MKPTAPTVSVWLPSYNHAAYLPAAIESVLAQTFSDWELVVVDDGSADGSLQIAERYADAHSCRITVLTHPRHENRGVEASASLAISRSRGRFLIGLASDDVLYPGALGRLVGCLEPHANVGFVYGYADLIDEAGAPIMSRRRFGIDLTQGGRALERLVQGNTIPSMTAMLRRECLEQAGPHHGGVVYSDWELFARAAAHWDVGFIGRALAGYRVHRTNVSWTATREVNLQRSLEVTAALRERATLVGGRLAEPRIRATLDLQMAFLRFAAGDQRAAADEVGAAFERDPTLAGDDRWLADWLWSRPLDRLLPDEGPRFVPWFAALAMPLVEAQARPRFRRAAGTAGVEEHAIRLASAGEPARAHWTAAKALARSPRRAADRRLGAVLLDSIAGRLPERAYRRARRLSRRKSEYSRMYSDSS
jgi:glycosyltransferase involved in cell wall biosynthesis